MSKIPMFSSKIPGVTVDRAQPEKENKQQLNTKNSSLKVHTSGSDLTAFKRPSNERVS